MVRALCSDPQTARFRVGSGEFAIAEGWGLEPGGVRGTGARVWPASVALARFVAAHPQTVRGKRCVEVGAGVGGLPALAAAQAGASSVVATDGEASTLPLLRLNVASNAGECRVQARQLRWGADEHPDLAAADVILGADVVWGGGGGSRQAQCELLHTLSRAAAARPSLVVLLSYCPRYKSEALFWEEASLIFHIAEAEGSGHEVTLDDARQRHIASSPHGAVEAKEEVVHAALDCPRREGGIYIYRLWPRVTRCREEDGPALAAESGSEDLPERGTDTQTSAQGRRALSKAQYGSAGEGEAGGGRSGQAGGVPGKMELWDHDLISDDSLLEAGGSGLHLDDLINPLDARDLNSIPHSN